MAKQVSAQIRLQVPGGKGVFGSMSVALFFNNFLPSNIGGDVVRISDTAKVARSKTLAAMAEFTANVAAALGAKMVRTEENAAGSALHEYGGLRMGRDAASSVTDPDGRFWRVGNLSCVDAAIWPHQGSANSYLTITAIALRNASRLAAAMATGGKTALAMAAQ